MAKTPKGDERFRSKRGRTHRWCPVCKEHLPSKEFAQAVDGACIRCQVTRENRQLDKAILEHRIEKARKKRMAYLRYQRKKTKLWKERRAAGDMSDRRQRPITYGDVTLTPTEWAKQAGISIDRLTQRLYTWQWPLETALELGPLPPSYRLAQFKQWNESRKVRIEYDGKCLTFREWAEETGLSERLIRQRYYYGWSAEDIFTAPVTDNHTARLGIPPDKWHEHARNRTGSPAKGR